MSIVEILDEIKEEDGQESSKNHLFREWLNYEGIIGYDYKIKAAIELIYNIDLD
jgi:hypothetical protein